MILYGMYTSNPRREKTNKLRHYLLKHDGYMRQFVISTLYNNSGIGIHFSPFHFVYIGNRLTINLILKDQVSGRVISVVYDSQKDRDKR
jgi:hypothetical protein